MLKLLIASPLHPNLCKAYGSLLLQIKDFSFSKEAKEKMLALSPPWFPSFGWPVEDEAVHEHKGWLVEDSFVDSYKTSLLHDFSPPLPETQRADLTTRPPDAICGNVVKKLSHNANERDRRKKLNSLYSSLRSLLPGTDHSRKLSIPTTVSRVLKYIPELQREVERLTERKEEIVSNIRRQAEKADGKRSGAAVVSSCPLIVTSQVDEREVVIQICTTLDHHLHTCLSKILVNLEEEGLQVLKTSSFAALGNRVFHNLHLQVKETLRLECEMLSEKLLSLYANG